MALQSVRDERNARVFDMKGGNMNLACKHGGFSDMTRLVGLALIFLIVVPSPVRATDGDLDITFGSGGKVITDFGGDDVANAVALQSDGKIVAAGRTLVGGVSSFALGRYNSDGSLDTTFGTGGKVTTDSLGDAFALSIRSDGKIVVAGGRTQSPSTFVLARYNSDGSLDTTFGSGGKVVRTDFSGLFVALVLQPDGKIVVAAGKTGDFVLVRYDGDGSLDTTFGSGGTLTTDFSGRDDEAYALAIQSDGKIVAAGRTTTTSGSVLSDFALARYNSDGSLDTTFGTGGKVTTSFPSPFPSAAYALALQSDGKIVVAGGGLDVESGIRLARYNNDGSLDITFGVGGKVGPYDPDAKAVALQPDGKIVVATIPFVSDVGLIRYNNDGSLDTTFGTGGYVSGDGGNGVVLQSDGKIVVAGCALNPICDFMLARYESGIRQRFVPVTPCRVVDTRNPSGPFGGPSLTGGATRAFVIPSGVCGIPATARAYSLNVTVVPYGFLGYLTLWPTGASQPLVSTLNAYDGQATANAAIMPAGTSGSISAYATNDTDLILDINGYFLNTISDAALLFHPLTPCRVADTRNPPGPLNGPILTGGETRAFPILSSACGIPATAQAYVLNATVVPSGLLAYLTLWPAGTTQPFVSTLNAYDGQVTANMAIVPAGAGGAINAFATQNTHLVLDVTGYFAPPASGGLSFYSLTPCRVVDTRKPPGPLGGPIMTGGAIRNFPILSGPCGAPAASQAYSIHTTVVPLGPLNYLTVWPAGVGQPLVSTLNAADGQVTSNSVIVPAGTAGAVSAFVTNTTDLIVDISGFFAP
jgi:uncharacterized delta-60 repeat protein